MKFIKPLSLIVLTFILLSSCAKIFYSPDAFTLAQKHKIFAILPPSVSIMAKKKVDPEMIKEQQKTESLNFQNEMFSWMLKRKMKGEINQEIQTIETTNTLLKRAGYPENSLTTEELCGILGVDGVMSSNYALSKPMSEGGAIALGLLVGFWGATNEVHATMSLNDCSNKKLIWNFDHKFSGGVGSSPARIVDALMRQASKKMPYMKL